MKKNFLFTTLFLITLLISSCGKKTNLPDIKDLANYEDKSAKFSMKYPSDWNTQHFEGESFSALYPKEATDRFRRYTPDGVAGVKIKIEAIDLTAEKTLEKVIQKAKILQPADQFYSAPEKVNINGIQATKLAYKFDANDGKFNGEKYFLTNDPKIVTVVTFECFGDNFERFQPKFQEILNSVKLAQPTVNEQQVVVNKEEKPASSVLKYAKGVGFKILIPDNFDMTKQGNNFIFKGKRREDCSIQVKIFDASAQSDLKKIVSDNLSKLPNVQPTKDCKLSGLDGYSANYQKSRTVKCRAYFVMKNDKLYLITLTWFLDEEKDYLPYFDKCVEGFLIQ